MKSRVRPNGGSQADEWPPFVSAQLAQSLEKAWLRRKCAGKVPWAELPNQGLGGVAATRRRDRWAVV
jgi:hypothetical protein